MTKPARAWGIKYHHVEQKLSGYAFPGEPSARSAIEAGIVPYAWANPVRVVIVPLARYRELVRKEKEAKP